LLTYFSADATVRTTPQSLLNPVDEDNSVGTSYMGQEEFDTIGQQDSQPLMSCRRIDMQTHASRLSIPTTAITG